LTAGKKKKHFSALKNFAVRDILFFVMVAGALFRFRFFINKQAVKIR
jgi:hypothetical protein